MRTPLRLVLLTLTIFLLLSLLITRFRPVNPAGDLVHRTIVRLQQSRPSWSYGRNSDRDPSYANSKSPSAQKQAELGSSGGATFEKDPATALSGSGKVGNGNGGGDRSAGAGGGYSPESASGSFSLHDSPLTDAEKQSLKDADRGFTSAEQASALKKLEMKYGDKLHLTDTKTTNDGSTYDPLSVYSTDSDSSNGNTGSSGSSNVNSGSSWSNAGTSTERNGLTAAKSKEYAAQHADSLANAAGGRVNNDGTIAPNTGKSSWSVGSGGSLLGSSSDSHSNSPNSPSNNQASSGGASNAGSANAAFGASISESERDKDRGFTDKEQALALEKLEQQYEQSSHAKPTWREKALAASAASVAAAAAAAKEPSPSVMSPGPYDGFSTAVRRASATKDSYGPSRTEAAAPPVGTPRKVGSLIDDIDKGDHLLPRVGAWGRKMLGGGVGR